ncbi:hypothetical protein STXM2123_2770 [Streptomyces sp. F-3]|nr:hypothetical protein STXM2123_2770 [Streptomyces sp. F-3]
MRGLKVGQEAVVEEAAHRCTSLGCPADARGCPVRTAGSRGPRPLPGPPDSEVTKTYRNRIGHTVQ